MELCLTSLWDFVFENEMGGPKIIQQDGPPRFYQQVFQQVLSGLSFIHAMGWVHRDIHPKNILIVNPSPKEVGDIRIKIADFGLAREIKTDDEQIQELTVINKLEKVSPLTVSGYFHAPELKTDSYDFKIDVYSAGLVLYFISRYHKDRQSVLMEIQDLRKGNLQVDENLYHKDDKILSALIKNLTQKDPVARHSACKAEDFMFPKARISTNSCEFEFLARKQEEEDLSLCTMNELTLSEMAEAIEHHTRVPKRRQTLRQERMVNGVAKRIKIEYDKDVKNIFHVAAKHGQEVVVVVSENEEVEMTDISTEPMSV
ncbi:eukaryotic translation initiation factor 2-alpha kinase 1-like [Dendronephthya gigantea]|uniref:eukaryotic translation initiation factor 2-alpha kinase 1-like n=1 Tax=Dendronephthya gigantea TaxID=151771 RepID=UPI00106AF198|nr:eukaryotic translation initiation factor 2-alpha kinase 1-like [Dendronephthya gigantea]